MRAGYENMLQRAVDAGARGPTSRLLHRRSVPANHRFPSPALVLVDSVQIRVCRNPPDGPVSGHPFCSSKTCPLEHVPGPLVPGIRRCPDSAKAEFLESEPHHLPQRFGRIAAALEVGVEWKSGSRLNPTLPASPASSPAVLAAKGPAAHRRLILLALSPGASPFAVKSPNQSNGSRVLPRTWIQANSGRARWRFRILAIASGVPSRCVPNHSSNGTNRLP